MVFKVTITTFICFWQVILNVNGQNINTDSNYKVNAINFFKKNINIQSEIYNGIVYQPPANATKGSVYFEEKNYLVKGDLIFKGILYNDIPLLYDVFNDLMVAGSPEGVNFILPATKVSDVYLDGHHFVYLNSNLAKTGFYEKLYGGNIEMFVKRNKHYSENVNSQRVEIYYYDEAEIFLKKGNKFIQIKGKISFFDSFQNKKKELKQYLVDNNINFNKDPEKAIVALLKYYEQIAK